MVHKNAFSAGASLLLGELAVLPKPLAGLRRSTSKKTETKGNKK